MVINALLRFLSLTILAIISTTVINLKLSVLPCEISVGVTYPKQWNSTPTQMIPRSIRVFCGDERLKGNCGKEMGHSQNRLVLKF